jgi:hypothetical protein
VPSGHWLVVYIFHNLNIGKWFKYAGESADNSTIIFMEKRATKDGSWPSSQQSPQIWKKSVKKFT